MGCRGSEVRILSPRPIDSAACVKEGPATPALFHLAPQVSGSLARRPWTTWPRDAACDQRRSALIFITATASPLRAWPSLPRGGLPVTKMVPSAATTICAGRSRVPKAMSATMPRAALAEARVEAAVGAEPGHARNARRRAGHLGRVGQPATTILPSGSSAADSTKLSPMFTGSEMPPTPRVRSGCPSGAEPRDPGGEVGLVHRAVEDAEEAAVLADQHLGGQVAGRGQSAQAHEAALAEALVGGAVGIEAREADVGGHRRGGIEPEHQRLAVGLTCRSRLAALEGVRWNRGRIHVARAWLLAWGVLLHRGPPVGPRRLGPLPGKAGEPGKTAHGARRGRRYQEASSRRSQARAAVQSRFTVAGDRSMASAISSIVMPPK